jgi:predicted transglutaminase-like cysteine proteinase
MSTLLKYLFEYRKIFAWSVALLVVVGLAWFALDEWHFKPLREESKRVESLSVALKKEQVALTECKMKKKTTAFESWTDSKAELLRRELEEIKNEENATVHTINDMDGWLF